MPLSVSAALTLPGEAGCTTHTSANPRTSNWYLLGKPATYYDDACFHQYILYRPDDANINVAILPPAGPYALRDANMVRSSVQMWNDGLHAGARTLGMDWLADGTSINPYVVGEDVPAIGTPKIVVVIADPSAVTPVAFAGVGEEAPVDGPCFGGASLSAADLSRLTPEQVRDTPGFDDHHGAGWGTLAANCGDGGRVCFVVGAVSWGNPDDTQAHDVYDLMSHEFGHCLGLGHVGDASDVPASRDYPADDIMSYEQDGHDAPYALCVSNLDLKTFAYLYHDFVPGSAPLGYGEDLDQHIRMAGGSNPVNAANTAVLNPLPASSWRIFRNDGSASAVASDCPQPDTNLIQTPPLVPNPLAPPDPTPSGAPAITITSPDSGATDQPSSLTVMGTVDRHAGASGGLPQTDSKIAGNLYAYNTCPTVVPICPVSPGVSNIVAIGTGFAGDPVPKYPGGTAVSLSARTVTDADGRIGVATANKAYLFDATGTVIAGPFAGTGSDESKSTPPGTGYSYQPPRGIDLPVVEGRYYLGISLTLGGVEHFITDLSGDDPSGLKPIDVVALPAAPAGARASVPAASTALVQNGCSGSLPTPDVLTNTPTCNLLVPANAGRIVVRYDTTYTGLFSANVVLNDPDGGERASGLNDCGIPDPGIEATFSCVLEVAQDVGPGTWSAAIQYQLGEVSETYTVQILAYPPSTPGPLTVDANGPYAGATGAAIPISASVAGGTEPTACSWSGTGATFASASSCATTVTFASAGSKTVQVAASDAASGAATDSATVVVTDAPPSSAERVEVYQGTAFLGSQDVGTSEANPATTWEVPVAGLAEGQTTLTAKWFDAGVASDGAPLATRQVTFTVAASPCTGAATPILSGLSWTATTSSATVAWTTDLPADGRLDYGATAAYGASIESAAMATGHSLVASGLAAGTVYHYRVTSTTACAMTTSSPDNTLTTATSAPSVTVDSPADGATVATVPATMSGRFDTVGATATTSGTGQTMASQQARLADPGFLQAVAQLRSLAGFKAAVPDAESPHGLVVVLTGDVPANAPESAAGWTLSYQANAQFQLLRGTPEPNYRVVPGSGALADLRSRAAIESSPDGPYLPGLVDGIGPGSGLHPWFGNNEFLCTASYILRDPTTFKYYVATAGHCLIDGEVEGEYWPGNDPTHKLLSRIEICVLSCDNNEIPLFGSYIDLRNGWGCDGHADPAYANYRPAAYAKLLGIGTGDDIGLIEVPACAEPMLRPYVPEWGGATGYQEPAIGDLIVHYGHGTYCCPVIGGLSSRTLLDQGRVALSLGNDGKAYTALGWLTGGDSGSVAGIGNFRQGKLVLGDGGFGINTAGIITGVGIFEGTLLSYGVQHWAANAGYGELQLVGEDGQLISLGDSVPPTGGVAITTPSDDGASATAGTTLSIAGTGDFPASDPATTYWLHRSDCGGTDVLTMSTIAGSGPDGGDGCTSLDEPVAPAEEATGQGVPRDDFPAVPAPATAISLDKSRKVHAAIHATGDLAPARVVGDFEGVLTLGTATVASKRVTTETGGAFDVEMDLEWAVGAPTTIPAGANLVFSLIVHQSASMSYINYGGPGGSSLVIPRLGKASDAVQVSVDSPDFTSGSLTVGGTPASWSAAWAIPGATTGTHTIYARALRDGAQLGAVASRTVAVGAAQSPRVVQTRLDGPSGPVYGWTDRATQSTGSQGTWSFTWAPATTPANGDYMLHARLRDGTTDLASSDRAFHVALAAPNVPPVADAGADQDVAAGAFVRLTGAASHDGDGTIATYAWSQTSGPAVTLSATSAVAPTFTAPAIDDASVLLFRLTVTDDRGATAQDAVEVRVARADRAPVLASIGPKAVAPGTKMAFQLAATDPDGDAILYRATGLPAGATLSPQGAFAWTPGTEGRSTVTFLADDGRGKTASETIQITVTGFVNAAAGANVAFLAPRSEWSASDYAEDALLSATSAGTAVMSEDGSGTPLFTWSPGTGRVAFQQDSSSSAAHGIVTVTPSQPRHVASLDLTQTKCVDARLTLFVVMQPSATGTAGRHTAAFDVPRTICDADGILEDWSVSLAGYSAEYVVDYVLAATATGTAQSASFQYGQLVAH